MYSLGIFVHSFLFLGDIFGFDIRIILVSYNELGSVLLYFLKESVKD